MKSSPAHPKKLHQPRPNLPLSALLLSLVVHLLVVFLLNLLPDNPVPRPQFQPTMVRLIERPQPKPSPTDSSQTEQLEIDPLPVPREPLEPVTSARKAQQEQRVKQEQAPRGIDSRDEFIPAPLGPPEPAPLPQPPPPPQWATPQPKTSESLSGSPARSEPSVTEETAQRVDRPPDKNAGDTPQQRQEALQDSEGSPLQPTSREDASAQVTPESPSKTQEPKPEAVSPAGKTPTAALADKLEQDLSGETANRKPFRDSAPGEVPESAPPSLTREQLFPDSNTLNRIAGLNPGTRNRVKERPDVEIGDTVWLNLEENLLVSFFRRFHDQVERVWNYPREAVEKGLEGTLQLKIVVDRNGKLIDVDLPQSSGSQQLDFAAIQAVYRAAPFGPITKHYPHETLTINAYFRYTLVGQYIFGRP